MEMNERIYMLRKRLGLTLEEVGAAVGVGKSTVKKWESGQIANMRRDKIAALAEALHTTPGYLMGWEDAEEGGNIPYATNILPMPAMKKLPLIGDIACGTPILAAENVLEDISVPEHINADCCLRCRGDSMIGADIRDGDIVYIKLTPEVHDGQIAAVIIGEEATLKRVYYDRDAGEIDLYPENPAYRPLHYRGEQLAKIRIFGKVVGFTRMLK